MNIDSSISANDFFFLFSLAPAFSRFLAGAVADAITGTSGNDTITGGAGKTTINYTKGDGNDVIGCASISFIRMMPTFDHITGKRAHLMNVYTRNEFRRQGIARKMVELLIEETWKKGVTEISLDATESGRPLYVSMGFTDSTECMVLTRE